jgi:hypothetical protein
MAIRTRALIGNQRVDRVPDPVTTGGALLGLIGIVVYVVTGRASWLSAAVLALGVGAAAIVIGRSGLGGVGARVALPPPAAAERPTPRWLLAIVGAMAVVTAGTASAGDPGVTDTDIAWRWIPSVALLLLAAWWWPLARTAARARDGWRPGWRATLPWVAVTIAAAVPRLAMLDRFPTVLSGDEGSFMVNARAAGRGELDHIFGPGFLGNPNLYPAMEGWLARLVGSSPADYRILSGIVGTVGVLATWRLGRRLVGPEAALAGAIVLATMPLSLHFSRSALNNITDPTALVVALLVLVRAITAGRVGDAAMAGVALGFGFYGYFGGRMFPVILLVALVVLVAGRRVRPREAIRLGGWMVAGFTVTALPLIMAFRRVPGELGGRLRQVSPFTRDALAADPARTIEAYLESLRAAVLAPFTSTPELGPWFFYRDPPMLGWPVVFALAIGAAGFAVRIVRNRDVALVACVVAPAAMLLGGVALTVPVAAQRLVALTPLYALVAGFGIVLVARWVGAVRPGLAAPAGRAALAVTLAAVVAGDLRWFATEDRQYTTYGDPRGTMMWDIGWRVAGRDPASGDPPAILFAGPPYVFTGGFNSLVIQAPELAMTDVSEPLGQGPAPELADGTMLVIVPERAGERCAAEAMYPSATVAEARDRYGGLIYIAVYLEPLRGWSTRETPAGSTFAVATDSPCR